MQLTFAVGLDRAMPPVPGQGAAAFGERYVGVFGLLEEIEVRVGRAGPVPSDHDRLLSYVQILRAVMRSPAGRSPFFAESFSMSPLSVARDLLERRDELVAAGVPLLPQDGMPVRMRDLCFVESHVAPHDPVRGGRADRIAALADALPAAGRPVSLESIRVLDPVPLLPTGIARLLDRIAATGVTVDTSPLPAAASPASRLGRVQRVLAGERLEGRAGGTDGADDESIVVAGVQTPAEGLELVARFLRARDGAECRSVALVTTGHWAWYLSCALAADGTPRTEAVDPSASADLSALALLPSLLFAPLDPQKLVSLLHSAASPLPRGLSLRLARALESEPGVGSVPWNDAIRGWQESVPDQALRGETKDRYARWFGPNADAVSVDERVVASRAAALYDDAATAVRTSPRIAHAAASIAAALRSVYGDDPISSGEIAALAGDVIAGNATEHEAEAGRPMVFLDAAHLTETVETVIWMPATRSPGLPAEFWRDEERGWLDRKGFVIRSAAKAAELSHAASVRALRQCSGTCVLVVPHREGGEPAEEHPIVVGARAVARAEGVELARRPLPGLLARLNAGVPGTLTETVSPVALPRRSAAWRLPPGTVTLPDTPLSPTSIATLCAFPYQYVLRTVAGFRRAPLGSLPSGPLLFGNVLHAAAAEYFREGPQGTGAVGDWMDRRFDAVLHRSALPLVQPAAEGDRERVRQAVRVTLDHLRNELMSRGTTAVGLEVRVEEAQLGAVPLAGRIDMLATGTGRPAIVDLKWGGRTMRADEISESRDIQLSLYAAMIGAGDGEVDLAYFVATSGLLIGHADTGFARAFVPEGAAPASVSVPRLLERIVATVEWRRRQLAEGIVELAPPETSELEESPEPVLGRPTEPDRYDDYGSLLGWGNA